MTSLAMDQLSGCSNGIRQAQVPFEIGEGPYVAVQSLNGLKEEGKGDVSQGDSQESCQKQAVIIL
jgi:hypothetical protein